MAQVKTYSPDRISCTAGPFIISGYAEGTFISAEPLGDGVSSVSGADGETARATSADSRWRVTITLLQTSDSNTDLNSLANADRASGGDGIFDLTLADLRGDTVGGGKAWVVSKPSFDFSDSIENREWVLEVHGDFDIGGNR